MVWVAVAGCALIACVVLYKWLTGERIDVNDKPNRIIINSLSKADRSKLSTVNSGQTVSLADTATRPLVAESPKTKLPSPPAIEVDLPSVESTIGAENSPMNMAPRISPAQTGTVPPQSKSPPRLKPPTFSSAPPRPGGTLRPPPSAASSLRVPITKVLSNTSMAPSSLMPPPQKKSRAVALEPGHSPLDWAALTSNPTNNLRGKDAPANLTRVTPSQLKAQNGRKGKDTWTVYEGKVYNISPYVPFHPGGKGEILRGAGKDSAKLFNEVHPWVNWDGMLKECMVGIYVSDEELQRGNELDEMD